MILSKSKLKMYFSFNLGVNEKRVKRLLKPLEKNIFFVCFLLELKRAEYAMVMFLFKFLLKN